MSEVPDGASFERPRGRIRRWLPALVLGLLILVASIVPLSGDGTPSPGALGGTELFHVLGYAALSVALSWAFGCNRWHDRRELLSGLGTAIIAASAYGAGIEVLQATIPWRSFATTDILLNVIGAALGALVVALVLQYRRARRPRRR